MDDVISLNPVFKRQHAVDILYMVGDVFEDFELDMSCDLNCEDDLSWNFDLGYGGIYENGFSADEHSGTSSDSELSGVMELE